MNNDDIAIKVSNLSKCYHIYSRPHDRLKQSVYPRLRRMAGLPERNYYREFWALRDTSFEIRKGETIGIVGRNGSGKSTLLQMICGTLNPTGGSVQTNGRIAALLELGSGFNPQFTGRENVYMNGAILGLSRDEIDARFDAVAAFADIGDFIEQPVKTYSSGMFVRLAFAANIMSDPQIMIVDEALAVGDMNFKAKCMTALTRIQQDGATILFVSHDIGTVKSLCSRAIHLDRGRFKGIGPSAEIAEQYLRTMREEMNNELKAEPAVPAHRKAGDAPEATGEAFRTSEEFDRRVAVFRYGTGEVRVAMVELLDLEGQPLTFVEFNQKVRVRVFLEAHAARDISVNVSFFDEKKINITGCAFAQAGQPLLSTQPSGTYLVEYLFDLPLQDGDYSVRVNVSAPNLQQGAAEFIDVVDNAVVFKVGKWARAKVWSKVHLFPELTVRQIRALG